MSAEAKRIILLVSLFVTGYLLVLAWDKDYGDGAASNDAAQTEGLAAPPPAGADGLDLSAVPGATAPAGGGAAVDVPAFEVAGTAPNTPSREAAGNPNLIEVQTDLYHLWINPTGGDIVRVDLKAYPVSLTKPDTPIRLLNDAPGKIYIAQSGLRSDQGPDARSGRATYQSSQNSWTMSADSNQLEVPLVWRSAEGLSVRKVFRFQRGAHKIQVEFTVDNAGKTPWTGNLFAQIKHGGQPAPGAQSSLGPQSYEGAAFTTTDDRYHKLDFEDLAETPFQADVTGGWVALLQHYFLSAWVPAATEPHHYYGNHTGRAYHVGLVGPSLRLAEGEQGSYNVALYAGPKIQAVLAELAPHLELAVDYGFLWWLAQPLFWLMNQIHSWVGNWGVAIILLTLIVKLILYPLSAMAYHSMANMRKLAPVMKRLQEQHREDRQKLSQEMMAFYRKEKVNPLGGCFPILLQMPVFLALYWVLYESVELRQAPFTLWIEDLALKDPYFVLPILMGLTMYLQQFLNPPIPDPIQARVIRMMPIIFTAFFLFFPSGLVLYWFINNLLSMAQQYWVNYQHKA